MTPAADDWVTFEGAVVPMPWGNAVYTVLPLPPDVAARLAPARRVEGEIAEHPVNLALSRAPVIEGVFLWAGRSLLDRLGIAPGEVVEVRLRPAPDDAVDTPDDLAAALRTANRNALWQDATPGRRRGWIYKLETAKRPETRARRIAEILAALEPRP